LLVPVILAPQLFAGGLIPLVGTWGYDQNIAMKVGA
jgi:hypothetical protein